MQHKLQEILKKDFPDAEFNLESEDDIHFTLHIKWSGFKGMSLIEQHKAIYKTLNKELESGELHALQIKTEEV